MNTIFTWVGDDSLAIAAVLAVIAVSSYVVDLVYGEDSQRLGAREDTRTIPVPAPRLDAENRAA